MNLTDAPWIPVIYSGGSPGLIGLRALFGEAHSIRDLSVQPHERIALFRLLLCITHAALDGPEDIVEREECGQLIQPAVERYLEKWRDSFELFGDGVRFLQLPNLASGKAGPDEDAPATKLDLSLASGNNSCLFDTAAADARIVSPARTALNLLAFQNFAPGGRIGVAQWNGIPTPGDCTSRHAPCAPSSMLHSIIVGENLLETIRLNLLTKETVELGSTSAWGLPVWEMPVASVADTAAIANATQTYLGRLAPLSRAIRLQEDGRSVVLGNGLEYPGLGVFREPMATVVVHEDEPRLLSGSIERSIWRQLPAITVRRKARAGDGAVNGPLALSLCPSGADITLWVGALVTDKAKIKDVVEGTYSLPAALFTDDGRKSYEKGVLLAEAASFALGKAVGAYAGSLRLETPDYAGARRFFWTRVEQHLGQLVAEARRGTAESDLAETAWGRAVNEAQRAAFDAACARRNPRQIQAYAAGLRSLHYSSRPKGAKKPKDQSA